MRTSAIFFVLLAVGLGASVASCGSSDEASATGASGSGGSAGSSDSGAGGVSPGAALTEQEYCKGIGSNFCNTQGQCCGKSAQETNACISKQGSSCYSGLQKELSEGRVKYHGEYATACIEEQKALFACKMDLYANPPQPNCDATVEGLVDEGKACANGAQCKDGLSCNNTTDKEGVCFVASKAGAECGKGCESGYVCGPDKTCITPLADGEACTDLSQCQPRSYCNGAPVFPPGGKGICALKKKTGEPCELMKYMGMECEGFMCDPGTKTCSGGVDDICQFN